MSSGSPPATSRQLPTPIPIGVVLGAATSRALAALPLAPTVPSQARWDNLHVHRDITASVSGSLSYPGSMVGDVGGIVLADLETEIAAAGLRSCSDEELSGFMSQALTGRQAYDGVINQLATEARRREATGCGAPAQEVIRAGGQVSNQQATTLDRRAGLGDVLPEVGERIDRGHTRSENADILARQLQRLTDPQRSALAAHDTEIARQAASTPPETFARWLAKRVRRITETVSEPGLSENERQRAASEFGMKPRHDGMWDLWGKLDQVRGAELNDVLTRAARQLNPQGATPNTKIDALHRLTTRRPTPSTGGDPDDLLAGFDPGTNRGIGYIVDAATLISGPHNTSLAQTWAGQDVDPATIGQLACDTDLYAILFDQLGHPTKIGRSRRAATREQRLQLRGLYDQCPLDGTPFGDCHIHHVNLPWEQGGLTELNNLLPISPAWHHRIHDQGWQLTMHPDRSLTVRKPSGELHRAIPPPIPISRE